MRRRNRKGGEKRRRTTIELSAELGQKLRELAARRGERGFSRIIGEAVEAYFDAQAAEQKRRQEMLALEGSIPAEDADEMMTKIRAVRESWKR